MNYYKIIECTVRGYEAGEIVSRCEARDSRSAKRTFGIDDGNAHLYECMAESRLAENTYDPRGLRRAVKKNS